MPSDNSDEDVPSPIDLRNLAEARAWVADTVARRPSRPRFFEAFVTALNDHFSRPFSVVELGSGPGHLAASILGGCQVSSYVAMDFSDAMHLLATEHLGEAANRVRFLTADFRDDWLNSVGSADAVITMQAVHEVRHKRHQPMLLAKMYRALAPGGLLLFCDHYWELGSSKHPDLYFEKAELPLQLAEAGCSQLRLLLDESGMLLYSGLR